MYKENENNPNIFLKIKEKVLKDYEFDIFQRFLESQYIEKIKMKNSKIFFTSESFKYDITELNFQKAFIYKSDFQYMNYLTLNSIGNI
jgi:hypothetical protein